MTQQIGLQAIFETASFQHGLSQFVSGLDKARGATSQTATVATAAGSALSVGMGAALGTLAGTILPQVIGKLQEFVAAGVGAVAELQRMDIMLETLSARQLIQAGAATNMTDALAKAGPVADVLLGKLKDLSLISPFEYKDVVNTFRLNVAFGQSTETALGLTKAITDMAAGMGLSGEFLERIAYNFSQMSLVGKVSARDIRDLAMAGVDLSAVLSTQLGKSVEEVNAALEDGSITFEDVSKAFIQYAEANFGGAAERMSRSIGGIVSSFKDLGFFASNDILGPVLESITQDLGALFDKAREFVDSGALKNIGAALGLLYDAIKTLPGAAIQAGSAVVDFLFGPLEGAANDAFSWGSNIIEQLASGIIEAAANALVAAMNFVGDMLANWLAPGSPPRVAPQIDQWGAAAMGEFLHGFTQTDFDILQDLQGPLENVFKTLEKTGDISKGAGSGMMAQFSEMFSEALAGGTIDPSFFEDLASAAGPFGDELSQLARLSLDYAGAIEAVTDAQNRLNAADKAQQDALEKSNGLISEYNDMLLSGASDEALAAKLAEINAAEEAARLAGEQKKQAETDLKTSEEKTDALQDQIDLTKDLIAQLLKLTEATLPPEVTETPEAGGAGGGADIPSTGGAGGGAGGSLGSSLAGGLAGSMDKLLNEAKNKVSQSAEEMKQALIEKLKNAFDPVLEKWKEKFGPTLENLRSSFERFKINLQTAWEGLTSRFNTAMEPVRAWWAENWPKIKEFALEAMGYVQAGWDSMVAVIQPSLDSLSATLQKWGIDWNSVGDIVLLVAKGLGVLVAVLVGAVAGALVLITGLVSGVVGAFDRFFAVYTEQVTKIEEGATRIKEAFSNFFETVGSYFQSFASGDITLITEAWQDVQDSIIEIKDSIIDAVWQIVKGPFELIGAAVEGFVENIIEWWETLSDELVGHSIIPDMMDAIEEVITDGLENVIEAIIEFVKNIIKEFEKRKTEIIKAAQKIIEGVQKAFKDGMDRAKKEIENALRRIVQYIESKKNEFLEAAKKIMEGFIDGVKNKVSAVISAIASMIAKMISAIAGKLAEFYAKGREIVQKIIDGISNKVNAIVDKIRQTIDSMVAKIREKLQEFYSKGQEIIQKIIDGVSNKFSAITQAAADVIQRFIDGLITRYNTLVEKGREFVTKIIEGITSNLTGIWNTAAGVISRFVEGVTDNLGLIYNKGRDLIERFKEGIIYAATSLVDAVRGIINQVVQAITNLLSGGLAAAGETAAPLTLNIQPQIMPLNAPQGMTAPLSLIPSIAGLNAFPQARQTSNPVMGPSKVVNFNMGGVTINNGMDMAMLENRMRNIVRKEIGLL